MEYEPVEAGTDKLVLANAVVGTRKQPEYLGRVIRTNLRSQRPVQEATFAHAFSQKFHAFKTATERVLLQGCTKML